MVVMSSYGNPLSECRDAMQLLKVAYDGILGIISVIYIL